MMKDRKAQFVRWAGLAFVVGGLLMVLFWIALTNVHGPTSVNEDRAVLGRTLFFWGRMLGGPPGLMIALGLIILYPLLAKGAKLTARIGYGLTLFALIIPAILDLFVWRALGPPLLIPLAGIGLILLARGNWHDTRLQGQNPYLLLLGILQIIAFVLSVIPLDISDQFGGYRIFGIVAYLLTGFGWTALGVSLLNMREPIAIGPAQS